VRFCYSKKTLLGESLVAAIGSAVLHLLQRPFASIKLRPGHLIEGSVHPDKKPGSRDAQVPVKQSPREECQFFDRGLKSFSLSR
jgi:hypothetical protein